MIIPMGIRSKPIISRAGNAIKMRIPRYDPPWSKIDEIMNRKIIRKMLIRAMVAPMIEVQL
jgi:hypothetical protein